LQIWRRTLNRKRVGLSFLFFIPAVWQVQIVKPTLFFDFLWDGCDFTLLKLNGPDRLSELEFYFPVQGVAPVRPCRSAHNNPQSFSEISGMMPNFAGVEKFFAHMTFKASGAAGHSCRKKFSTRQILNANSRSRAAGQRWSSPAMRTDYLDATTGDIQLNLDWRASLPARLRPRSRGIEDIYELTYIRKDGSRFPAVVSVTALRDEQGAIIG
jgi:hypothetical protein